jgi:hypothetical protein
MNVIIEFPIKKFSRDYYYYNVVNTLLKTDLTFSVYLRDGQRNEDFFNDLNSNIEITEIGKINFWHSSAFKLEDDQTFLFFSHPNDYIALERCASSNLIGYFDLFPTELDSWTKLNPQFILTKELPSSILQNIDFSDHKILKDKLLFTPIILEKISNVPKRAGSETSKVIILYDFTDIDKENSPLDLSPAIKALKNSSVIKTLDVSNSSVKEILATVESYERIVTISVPNQIQYLVASFCAINSRLFQTWPQNPDNISQLLTLGLNFKTTSPGQTKSIRTLITDFLNIKSPDSRITLLEPEFQNLDSIDYLYKNILNNQIDESQSIFSILSKGNSWDENGNPTKETSIRIIKYLQDTIIDKDSLFISNLIYYLFLHNDRSLIDETSSQNDKNFYFSIIEKIRHLYSESYIVIEKIISEYGKFSQFALFENYLTPNSNNYLPNAGLIFSNSFFKSKGNYKYFFNLKNAKNECNNLNNICKYLKLDIDNNRSESKYESTVHYFKLQTLIGNHNGLSESITKAALNPRHTIVISILLTLAGVEKLAIEVLKSVSSDNINKAVPNQLIPHTNYAYFCACCLLNEEPSYLNDCIDIIKINKGYFAENSWNGDLHYTILTAISCKRVGLSQQAQTYYDLSLKDDITGEFAEDWFNRTETKTNKILSEKLLSILPTISSAFHHNTN